MFNIRSKALSERINLVTHSALDRLKTIGSAIEESRSLIKINEFGKAWSGICDLLGGFVAFATIFIATLGWLLTMGGCIFISRELGDVKKSKEIEEAKVRELGEIVNEQHREIERNLFSESGRDIESFGARTHIEVPAQEILRMSGTVKYPRDCPLYWVLFLDPDDLVWPRLSIKNTGLPSQGIDISIAIPPRFDRGELVLACVEEEVSEQFTRWLREGQDAPLLKPSFLDIVLKTSITVQ